jgi:hypothetical protein
MVADRPLHILIANDDADTCAWTALFLRIWGFEPFVVGHAPEALQSALLHLPDIVALDSQEAGIQAHRVKPNDVEVLLSRLKTQVVPGPEHRRVFLDSSLYGRSR